MCSTSLQTMYTIAVVTDVGTYEVRRRYSEFRTLRDNLKRALPSETFHFPAKKRNPLKDNFGTAFLQVWIDEQKTKKKNCTVQL